MPTDEDGFFYAEPNPAREKERQELLAMDDSEAASLSFSMQYQRNRYLREIEGMEFVKREQEAARRIREKKNTTSDPEPKKLNHRLNQPRKQWDRGLDKD